MRRSRKIALAVVVTLVVLLVGGYWYERPMLLTGTGYAAHNACAVTQVAGRDDPEDDLPPNPLVPVLRASSDGAETTASLLGVLAKQRAWYTPGYGCTLADEEPDLPPATPVAAGNPISDSPEPEEPSGPVAAALAHAFGDDLDTDERDELGTRAVVVLKDGKLVAERYADGFDAATPQLGWSMTKSVTNLLVGRLVLRSEISLDDDRLLPIWKDDRKRITIRQLLQMTSGLEWDETYALGTPITRMLYTEPDMAAYVAAQELAHAPGSHLQYSSGSTTLLCSILAQGRGGADFPRRELFEPLGLRSAVLEPDASGTPVCSSYLWATPRDWAAIGQLALDDGMVRGRRLLPEGWIDASTKAVVAKESEEDGYASGWWSNTGADGKVVHDGIPGDAFFAQGHDGQLVAVVPSERLVMVRMGFTPERDDDRGYSTTSLLIDAVR